jgi:hypothetical protein
MININSLRYFINKDVLNHIYVPFSYKLLNNTIDIDYVKLIKNYKNPNSQLENNILYNFLFESDPINDLFYDNVFDYKYNLDLFEKLEINFLLKIKTTKFNKLFSINFNNLFLFACYKNNISFVKYVYKQYHPYMNNKIIQFGINYLIEINKKEQNFLNKINIFNDKLKIKNKKLMYNKIIEIEKPLTKIEYKSENKNKIIATEIKYRNFDDYYKDDIYDMTITT